MSNNHYNKTKEFFDLAALEKEGFYEAESKEKLHHSVYQLKARKKIISIFNGLKTLNNLDVGCGNGDFIISLAKTYPNLDFTGVDFSKEMIKKAKNNSRRLKNTKLSVGSILSLNLKDKSYDTVFCINTLHHVKPEDLRTAIKELSRIAKNNIILEIKNRDSFYFKYIRRNPENKIIKTYPTNITTIKSIMEELGFKLDKIKPIMLFPFLSLVVVLHFTSVS